jgi:hypothetical protein
MDSIQKMDDVLLRAPPNVEDPPAIEKLLAAIEQARTLARVPIEQMNSPIFFSTSMPINAILNSRSVIWLSDPHRNSAFQVVKPVHFQ